MGWRESPNKIGSLPEIPPLRLPGILPQELACREVRQNFPLATRGTGAAPPGSAAFDFSRQPRAEANTCQLLGRKMSTASPIPRLTQGGQMLPLDYHLWSPPPEPKSLLLVDVSLSLPIGGRRSQDRALQVRTPQCHTDCIEAPLSRLFRRLGSLVGRYPWVFLLLPVLLSAGLGSGFMFLAERKTNNIEEQFTPVGGPAKGERSLAQEHFPTNDSQRFSATRLTTEGSFASLLVVNTSGSLLTPSVWKQVRLLDTYVKSLSVKDAEGVSITYKNQCAGTPSECSLPNPLLQFQDLPTNLTFPILLVNSRQPVFLGSVVGGVELGAGTSQMRSLEKAKALRLVYYLREDSALDREKSREWLDAFLQNFSSVGQNLQVENLEVFYFTSLSRQKEFEGNVEEVIPLFSVSYFLIIFFSIVSCYRMNHMISKMWVAAFGVISAGLAVVSSFGLLLYCGMPYVLTVSNAPFLILGVGVDDMFIMVSAWQRTKLIHSVEERLADTYAEAAVSITITTLTDVLAFYIGTMTSFKSVQAFCIYTGTTLLFCFIYNITCFGAFLALNGKVEVYLSQFAFQQEQGRYSVAKKILCRKSFYISPNGEEEIHAMNVFFRKYYGPLLTNVWSKLFVLLLYAGYLAASIYGCFQIQEGIDLRNLANDNSYIVPYYTMEKEYFSEFGPRIMVLVTKSIPYWDELTRNYLDNCIESLENSQYMDKTFSDSWLSSYESYLKDRNQDINDRTIFFRDLDQFLKNFPEYRWDIQVNSTAKEILSSRFFIQSVNVSTAVSEKMMLNQLRSTASQCDISLAVYHPAFIYYDQYSVIVDNTIQNVVVAAGAMLVISLLFIPNPLCSLWVTFAIASVIVGVAGFMSYWDVNLDSISMINLIICIGFSVDFSAHISYAFVSSDGTSANQKVIEALDLLGYPVVQGAASTIIGVVALAAANAYIFRTFFKIMFLVIMFGAAHGLIFIPVFLTFFGICSRAHEETPCRDPDCP
ncbi:patched domain-containing protein 3 [Dromiciops gliroides]|uniref:patched domain-containing protein 3 n=1 Tax=Dromiciops gliroides TaxID=33562 RepID=UPI001CC6A5D0|nr:patched domain-containing protein 3 [Dromiciops gliroides]